MRLHRHRHRHLVSRISGGAAVAAVAAAFNCLGHAIMSKRAAVAVALALAGGVVARLV